LKYFTDFCLKTALSTEFKVENVASVLVLPAVKKRKKHTGVYILPLDIKKGPEGADRPL
jgi:flavoprotein